MISFLDQFFDETTVKIISKIIYILILLITAKIFIFILRKFINKVFLKRKINERKSSALSTILFNVSKYMIYFFVVYSILNTLFGTTVQSLLAIAGIGSIAVGFGAQSLVKDCITGFFIMLEDQYAVGDIVSIDEKTGIVEVMGLRTTRIRGFDGDVYIIPNGEIKTVTNKSYSFTKANVDIVVSYKESLDNIFMIMNDELEQFSLIEDKMLSKPIVLGVMSFNESSVTIRITVDCMVKEDARIERAIRKHIKDRFDREGIMVPYNHMIVHMDQKAHTEMQCENL